MTSRYTVGIKVSVYLEVPVQAHAAATAMQEAESTARAILSAAEGQAILADYEVRRLWDEEGNELFETMESEEAVPPYEDDDWWN